MVVADREGTVVAAVPRGEATLGARVDESRDGALSVALRGRQATRERTVGDEDELVTSVPVLANDEVVGAVRVAASDATVPRCVAAAWAQTASPSTW